MHAWQRENVRRSGGACAPEAKVKYAAAPASRSIMRRVTHASLLHCEPCYASARQGTRRIYGGISAVIERYAPSSRYLFLPVGAGAPRRFSTRLRSSPRCCSILRVRAAAKATGIGFDVFRKYWEPSERASETINQSAIFEKSRLKATQICGYSFFTKISRIRKFTCLHYVVLSFTSELLSPSMLWTTQLYAKLFSAFSISIYFLIPYKFW